MSRSYERFVDDAVGASYLMLVGLAHRPVGLPVRCGSCNMTWPCDARRRADALGEKWAVSDGGEDRP